MRTATWGWSPPLRAALAAATLAGSLVLAVAGRASDGDLPPPDFALRVDLNTAPRHVLLALPGLGPSLANRIVEARDRDPIRSLDDLDARVSGIGPAKVFVLRPFVRVGEP